MGLKKSADKFKGEVDSPDPVFKAFDTMRDGFRAGAKVLLVYYMVHGLNTVAQIIKRWAPGIENNTDAYIKDVCERTGWQSCDPLNLTETDTLVKLVTAIAYHENGEYPADANTIEAGCVEAHTA